MNLTDKATDCAKKSLQMCFSDGKIIASPAHFSDFWARDAFWAASGALAAGEIESVKKTIDLFLSYQRNDGKIPRKISRDWNGIKYLTGKSIPRKKPRPVYTALVRPFYSMDENALLVRAALAYIKATNDMETATQWYPKLRRTLSWYEPHLRGGVLYEGLLANWMDTVFKFGAVLYTNVVYAEGLRCAAKIAEALGKDDDFEKYSGAYYRTREEIQKTFWNGRFFCDEARRRGEKTFDLAGNVLTVYFSISDEEQSRAISEMVAKEYAMRGAFLPAVPTGHRWWKINPVARSFGIADYHTDASWLWIDIFAAEVLRKNGEEEIARRVMDDIARVIVRDGEVGETYFGGGTPYRKRLWKSANPFAWSSGVFLEIVNNFSEKL